MLCCGNLTAECFSTIRDMKKSEDTAENTSTSLDAWLNAPDESYNVFFLFSFGYVLTLLVIIGCATNAVSIILFSNPSLWSYANYYIIAVATWDVALLVSAWFSFALPALIFQGSIEYAGHPIIYTYPFTYTLCNIAMVGCVWITVALSIDRYFAIKHPLLHRRHATKTLAYRSIGAVSLLAVLYNIPRYFELVLDHCVDYDFHELPVVNFEAGLNMYQPYFTGYRVVGGLLFCSIGPCLLLFTLTVLMKQALRRAKLTRDTMKSTRGHVPLRSCRSASTVSGTRRNDKSADRLLLLVLIKFLLCYSLPTIIDILEQFLSEQQFKQQAFIYMVEISDLLVILHSSTNFFIYIVYGSKVRRLFVRLATIRKKNRRDSDPAAMELLRTSSRRQISHQSSLLTAQPP